MRSRIDVLVRNEHLHPRDVVEELGAEVVGHEAVVAGERRGHGEVRAPGLHRQRRQVETRRPALGAADEVIDLRIRQPDHTGAGQERVCLRSVHRELIDPDLDDAAPRRRRATGTGTSRREPIAELRALGRRIDSSAIMSRDAGVVTSSA